MSTKKRQIGDLGERLAKNYLMRKGYKIIDTNFHSRFGEIDLIVQNKQDKFNPLVFIEVKTRTSNNFGSPEESVDALKKSKIVKTIINYLEQKNIMTDDWQVDIVAVDLFMPDRKARISHLKAVDLSTKSPLDPHS